MADEYAPEVGAHRRRRPTVRSPRVPGERMSPRTLREYGEKIRAALAETPRLRLEDLTRLSGGCPTKIASRIRARWRRDVANG